MKIDNVQSFKALSLVVHFSFEPDYVCGQTAGIRSTCPREALQCFCEFEAGRESVVFPIAEGSLEDLNQFGGTAGQDLLDGSIDLSCVERTNRADKFIEQSADARDIGCAV